MIPRLCADLITLQGVIVIDDVTTKGYLKRKSQTQTSAS